ncbi:Homeodomain-containing protein [Artemisia annua]|uniref:Homeodomain-containing protein n=1 Tax=Artemisia annua TaxID=35608 RepID=A0A2U1N951_ARTAN|nr:Homeodomain-containing protein [Artemisia annua]
MELRENNLPQSNQVSSSLYTYAPINSPNIIPDQPHLHQRNQYHSLQQEPISIPIPDSDPAEPLASQTPVQRTPLDNVAVAPVVVRYKECQKNHAASMGSHVLDGCGEFMPNGEEGTPESLKCAACECHRSFHRREAEGESQSSTWVHTTHYPQPPRAATVQPPLQQHHHHHRYNQTPPMMMAFGGTSSSEEHEHQPSRKRFRTKFTEQQKERMHEFAERIGWKIQKQDDQAIMQFCNEVGLKRKVFKVWMHNCKQASKKKQHE